MGRRSAPRNDAVGGLAKELAALPGLSRTCLKERWRDLYGTPPPANLGRGLLLGGIAYRMQEKVLGGLGPTTRRRLAQATNDLAAGRAPAAPRESIKPGTRLLREWQGAMHEVIALERGVQYRGKQFPSLSAVAREITGTRWSGPLFFGLKGHPRDGD